MKAITIRGTEYLLFSAGESDKYMYPHMVVASTGEIPKGQQCNLLIEYLTANGVTPKDRATTHWCIAAAMKINKTVSVRETSKTQREQANKGPVKSFREYLPITVTNIEEQDRLVLSSNNYGKEWRIIHDVLNAFPANEDLNTVAMKIAVIDVTNSTHLAQYKSQISLYDLAKFIVEIRDFDQRLEHGDPDLVNEIARNKSAINMFSFASKYCTYHNVEIYERDDYSIFDGIVKEALPSYINGLSKYKIDTWRATCNYSAFNCCIGKLLDNYNIHIPFRRRKFDHFLWYANR